MLEINQRLIAWATEATELRGSVSEPNTAETVEDLHERLIATRKAQDRLEAIVADLGRLRSRSRIRVAELQDAYDDAWRNSFSISRVGEYDSAKAQDARHTLAAMNEMIELRKAKRLNADIEEVYDFVVLKHRGLNSSRQDLDLRIKMLSVAGYLEH